MYNIQSFTPIALLAILSYQMLSASAQNSSAHISPTAAKSTPTPTSTDNPTSETTIPPYYEEYRFLYPVTPDFTIITTSYKDTLNVSWEVFAPYDFPELWITCWLRNSTGPSKSLLDLEESLFNVTSPNTTSTLISLEPFKPYNPCQMVLGDRQNRTMNSAAFTGFFNISNTSTTTGHVWSLQSPAPIYNGSGNPNTGCRMLGGGGGLLWMAMLMVLLVGSLDMNVLA